MEDPAEKFRTTIEAFVRRAASELLRLTKDETMLPARRAPVILFAGSSRNISASEIPSWSDLATFSFYQKLSSLPETEEVRKVAGRYPPIRQALTRMSKQNEQRGDEAVAAFFVMQWLVKYLDQYLLRTKSVVGFSEPAFQEAFDAVDGWLRGAYRIRVFAGLFRFEMGDSLLDLGPVRIRRMTNEEKAGLFARFEAGVEFTVEKLSMDILYSPRSILDAEYVLEAEADLVDASATQPLRASMKAFEDAMTAIRLLRPCGAYLGPVYHYQLDWLEESRFSGPELGEVTPIHGPIMKLSAGDITVLKSLFDKVAALSKANAPGLALALDRYERTLKDARPEDRVVDAFIGLEALVLAEKQSELAYRLALRLGMLLGESAAEKRDVFDFVRKAYHVRSKIVHGDRAPNAADISSRLQDLLREGIRRVLDRPAWHHRQTLVRDLDTRLFS